ncbi:MAG: FAD-binding and (Fe-S)-binding domain-containing protein [Actinomycetaceae bacterium]|nr:FAD-binding and (Fe-S)-binding domain-containing protein [Actinomycetaceae bacterium]
MRGDVDASARRRAEYSTDASNYRIPPRVVAFPLDADDVAAALSVARELGVPITSRGGGTSCAGNSIGPGIVLDFSRHMNAILEIDPQARTARVQPGVVMSDLQKAAAPYGLRFGPDPSTLNRATFGGMIGNNACGPHAVAFGRTADNVAGLELLMADGRRVTAGPGTSGRIPGLDELVASNLALIRTELGRFKRQVSGYSLEHLLPERGRDLAAFLVGSEGTLGIVTEATLKLVPLEAAPALVVLGYPDMASAADDVVGLLDFEPLAIEGIDARLVDVVRRAKGSVPELPAGAGWLFVEVGARDGVDAVTRARQLAAAASTEAVDVREAGPQASQLWRIRADGAGLGGRTPAGHQAWPGWEDSAVPPEHLGDYIRALESLLASYGLDGLLYGHFGDGCLHIRIDFPLEDDAGRPVFRRFMEEAADLAASFGGSLSGEHGDGRARSELLGRMYGPQLIELFGRVKDLFDPEGLLNPGVLVRPDPVDAHLRRPQAGRIEYAGGFHFADEGGDMSRAVHHCTGVGNCRASRFDIGMFMCPSYEATRDEKDVTRGRARVLQEVANGRLIGWDSPELLESLDLCLSCKACSRDCPTGIDVARYRSEALYRAYRGKLRPASHYTLGQLPRLAGLVTRIPLVARLANAFMKIGPLRRLGFAIAGVDGRRSMADFATRRFSRTAQARAASRLRAEQLDPRLAEKRYVMLWADSFSETLDTRGARAAVEVLQEAGYTVLLPPAEACCGLTWISTGQLATAKKKLEGLLATLAPFAANGVPIVGVEPSCTAVLRSDLEDLLPDDARTALVRDMTYTLAELLTAPEPIGPGPSWHMPNLSGLQVVAQPHCHHYSVMGWDADEKLLASSGADVTKVTGCCGLAGNFGMEKGHYDVSVKVARARLLPALESAGSDAIFLADGFSCRTQAGQLASSHGIHLAELIRDGLGASRLKD